MRSRKTAQHTRRNSRTKRKPDSGTVWRTAHDNSTIGSCGGANKRSCNLRWSRGYNNLRWSRYHNRDSTRYIRSPRRLFHRHNPSHGGSHNHNHGYSRPNGGYSHGRSGGPQRGRSSKPADECLRLQLGEKRAWPAPVDERRAPQAHGAGPPSLQSPSLPSRAARARSKPPRRE